MAITSRWRSRPRFRRRGRLAGQVEVADHRLRRLAVVVSEARRRDRRGVRRPKCEKSSSKGHRGRSGTPREHEEGRSCREIIKDQLPDPDQVEEALSEDWFSMNKKRVLDALVEDPEEQGRVKDVLKQHYVQLDELFKTFAASGSSHRGRARSRVDRSSRTSATRPRSSRRARILHPSWCRASRNVMGIFLIRTGNLTRGA